MENLGRRMKRIRLRAGLTQEAVAGPRYTAAYISTIEAGKRQPSRAALEHFASKLGTTLDELETGRSPHLREELGAWLQEAREAVAAGDVRRADALTQKVLRRAKETDLTLLTGKAIRIKGLLAERAGHLERAVELYEEAEATLADYSPVARTDAIAGKARCYHSLGEVHYAIHLLEAHASVLRHEGLTDVSAMLRTQNTLIACYFDAGLRSRAEKAAQECIDLAPRVEDAERLADMQINVARILLEDGHYEEAQAAYNTAETLYRSLDWKNEQGIVHLARGFLFLHRDRFDEADHELSRAIEIFHETGHSLNELRTTVQLGRLRRLQGRIDEAQMLLRSCIKKEDRIAEVGMANRELAALAIAQGSPEKAQPLFERALEILEEAGDLPELAITYRVYGDFLKENHGAERACDAYRTAAVTLERAA